MSPPGQPTRAETGVAAVLWGAATWGLYVVFISSVTPLESAVGAAFAVLAAVAAAALGRVAHPVAGPVRGLAAAVALWPLTVCRELGALVAAIAAALAGRGAEGEFRTVRLRPGLGSAWASGLLSATPGSYVVALNENQDEGRPDTATAHALFPGRPAVERAITEEDDGS